MSRIITIEQIEEDYTKCVNCGISWVHGSGRCAACLDCPATIRESEAWARVRPVIREMVPEPTFNIWFTTVHIHQADKTRVVLGAHTDLLPWLTGRYAALFRRVFATYGISTVEWEACHVLPPRSA